jgi:hypothetical protein
MKLSPGDRRSESRRTATGEVHLREPGEIAGNFSGLLLDQSAAGFRARHERLTLASGCLVDFEFAGRSGKARAVWTRIENNRAETGFRIVME